MPKPNLASMSIDALLKLPAEEGESVKEDGTAYSLSMALRRRIATLFAVDRLSFKRRSIPPV
jgi:hypothetical protein